MDKYKRFLESFESAVKKLRTFDKKQIIRVISHLDADGISACAIVVRALNRENMKYSISIVPQLDRERVLEFSKEDYSYYIFSDLGSGQLKNINELLSDKQVIILDHHEIEDEKPEKNITQINPHLYEIDGSKEISGAGVAYFFAAGLNKKNGDMAHIAIIGAIGDVQEDRGFLPLNKEILKTAVRTGKMEVKRGLKFFGMQTKPLHKILEYSSDPYIPEVSGSESGAIQFLHQIGINPKKGKSWKKIVNLDDAEMEKLITGIIMKRLNETTPEDVLGDIYILAQEPKESPTRDAREYATLLNACGRMNRPSFGVGVCLGEKKDRRRALQTLLDYKKEIVSAMRWFEGNKEKIIKGNGFIILNAENNISPTIIGTTASIISKSNDIKEGTYVMSLARKPNKKTKISLRMSRNKKGDLRKIMSDIVLQVGGEAGGHKYAAGALIETDKEQQFIEIAKDIMEKN